MDNTGFDGIVKEGSLKLLPGAVQARHYRADGHAQSLGRVLVGKAFNVDQENHLAMERRELLDRFDDLRSGELVEHVSLRLGAFVAELVVKDELADVVEAHVFFAGSLEAVPEQVSHDREEPGLHVRARLVAVLVTQGAEVSLLHQVLGLVRVTGQAECAAVQHVEMSQCLFRKGSARRAFRH